MLTGFSVENYRAFSRLQNIEIRPLTLFFGWNSGGKSALVRFLPLMAESIHASGPPIWLSGDVGRQATWPELVCKATQRGNLKLSLSWDDFEVKWEILGDLEGRWQETKSLVLNATGDLYEFPLENESARYKNLIEIRSCSFAPRQEKLVQMSKLLRDLANNIQWISGVRVRPPRVVTYGGGVPSTLCSDGADAVTHLIAAQLKSSTEPLLEVVRAYFASLGEQLVLDNPIGGVWRILLRPIKSQTVDVSICDTGEGYAQVLPVLVALARARIGEGPKLLCLEQPELHLHTRAQAQLANFLVQSVLDKGRPQVLVETHSEVLLTSVQLAIARGEIKPEMVRVYWVESRADGTSDAIPVDFNEFGEPMSGALIGAFKEANDLAQQLVKLQITHK